jgi:hypothetical protein
MIGAGLGVSLVALTSAGLSGIDPRDAGAASGLINVSQQLGAALGLAVLVTVFDTVTGGAASALGHVTGRGTSAAIVHGLDWTFAAGSLFAFAAIALVAIMVRTPSEVRSDDAFDESSELELVEAA